MVMGGSITVESEEGVGTTFTDRIPALLQNSIPSFFRIAVSRLDSEFGFDYSD